MDRSNFEEIGTASIQQIIDKVSAYDEFLTNAMMAEIRSKQPFVRSLITGFQRDLKPEELEETQRLIFILWDYFKSVGDREYATITESQFGEVMNRNIAEMQAQEENAEPKSAADRLNLPFGSHALFEGIQERMSSHPVFAQMETEIKGLVAVGMKSLIECFEQNAKTKEVKKSKGFFGWW